MDYPLVIKRDHGNPLWLDIQWENPMTGRCSIATMMISGALTWFLDVRQHPIRNQSPTPFKRGLFKSQHWSYDPEGCIPLTCSPRCWTYPGPSYGAIWCDDFWQVCIYVYKVCFIYWVVFQPIWRNCSAFEEITLVLVIWLNTTKYTKWHRQNILHCRYIAIYCPIWQYVPLITAQSPFRIKMSLCQNPEDICSIRSSLSSFLSKNLSQCVFHGIHVSDIHFRELLRKTTDKNPLESISGYPPVINMDCWNIPQV